jgi:hypothetical protein
VARQPDGAAKTRHHLGFARDEHQILQAAQLADFIVFIRHQGLVQKGGQGKVSQRQLCCHPFLGVNCRYAGQLVARAQRAGLGHQCTKAIELEAVCA